MAKNSRNMSPC